MPKTIQITHHLNFGRNDFPSTDHTVMASAAAAARAAAIVAATNGNMQTQTKRADTIQSKKQQKQLDFNSTHKKKEDRMEKGASETAEKKERFKWWKDL